MTTYQHMLRSRSDALCLAIKQGDDTARPQLVLCYLDYFRRCVYRQVRLGRIPPRDVDDVVSAITVMALKQVARFDPDLGAFSTFMRRYIQQVIVEYIAETSPVIKTPHKRVQQYYHTLRIYRSSTSMVSVHDLVDQAKVPMAVARMVWFGQEFAKTLSLDAPRFSGSEDADDWSTLIVDNTAVPADVWCQALKVSLLLRGLVANLPPRERRVIDRFFFSGEDKTYRELGEEFGVSLEWVRQCKESALARLRQQLKAQHINSLADM